MLSPGLTWFKTGHSQPKEAAGSSFWTEFLLNVANVKTSGGKLEVSQELNTELVRQIGRIFGMHFEDALALVDSFFGEKTDKFEYLRLLEDRIVQL
mmetsp:Transcript_10327/g.15828  ORF Transcript_10327/g.15828 Transcript_10327/m.15828 type:complete len:96 (+) Transcript_10327:494-781(+)